MGNSTPIRPVGDTKSRPRRPRTNAYLKGIALGCAAVDPVSASPGRRAPRRGPARKPALRSVSAEHTTVRSPVVAGRSNCQPQRPRSWGVWNGDGSIVWRAHAATLDCEGGWSAAGPHRTRRASPGPVRVSPPPLRRHSDGSRRWHPPSPGSTGRRGPHPGPRRPPFFHRVGAITQVRPGGRVLIPRVCRAPPRAVPGLAGPAAGRRRASSRGGGRGRRPESGYL